VKWWKNLAGSFNHALTILCISNWQQNVADSELLSLLQKYQNKSLGKGFIHWIEHGFTIAFKTPENTQCKLNESKLWKQICIELTFILFKEVLKSTELLLWVRGRSANVWFRLFKNFAVSQIISSFCFAVGFWEGQSIKGQNLQITDCVLNEHFQNCCSSVTKLLRTGGHSRFAKSVYPQPQTGLRYMWQSARANTHLAVGKNSLGGAC